VNNKEFGEITGRLDEIIGLLKAISQPPPRVRQIVDILATGAGILGILSVADIIKAWLGG
jgi:hypothetical protein